MTTATVTAAVLGTAMLDFGCGTGSHSHFQFVTVSQTAAGQRLARTPLATGPIRDSFNKLHIIYIYCTAAAAAVVVPSPVPPTPSAPTPTVPDVVRRRRRGG